MPFGFSLFGSLHSFRGALKNNVLFILVEYLLYFCKQVLHVFLSPFDLQVDISLGLGNCLLLLLSRQRHLSARSQLLLALPQLILFPQFEQLFFINWRTHKLFRKLGLLRALCKAKGKPIEVEGLGRLVCLLSLHLLRTRVDHSAKFVRKARDVLEGLEFASLGNVDVTGRA